MKLVKKNISIISILIAVFLLIVFSPIFTIIWLCLPSVYFLYQHNYRNFFNIWVVTLLIWHSIFTFMFLDFGPIITIGGNHTKELINYLLNDQTIWFSGVGYQTIYIFDAFSQKIGFLIYIPVVFPILKTDNSPSSPNKNKGWFDGGDKQKKDVEKDFNQCGSLLPYMTYDGINVLTKSYSKISEDGKRVVTASRTYMPFMRNEFNCTSRPLSKAEKDLLKANKK